MASSIKFKRSAVQNRVPTTSQLDLGELALNTYDGKLYTEINTGSAAVVEIGSKLSSLVVDGDNGGGNGDVVFHGATAGRDVTWDHSTNFMNFADNAYLSFGASNDLQIVHNGGQSIIQDSGTGSLNLLGNNVTLGNASGNDNYIGCHHNAQIDLYHNNNIRVTTTDDGADISGTGSLKLPVGTTAQRNSSPTAGDMRYNSEIGSFEGYTTGWGALGGESGVGIGSTTVNPGSGVVNPLIGVGYTTINFVGAGLSVTGYGTTIVVDLGGAVSRKYGRKIHAYTATANQTTFAGLSYTNAAAQISVYLNGAKLSAATYTATSGSTVVLGTGASVGDEIEIICIDSGVDLSRNVTSYTATANQTTFTGLGYSDGGDLDVYLNGIRLAQSDYTANNGTSLVLAAGASVGDLLEVVDMGQGAQWSSGFGADPDDIYRLNGGVGIGTTNPTDKLNIVGNVEVLGILTATTFKGDGSNLTGIAADKIWEGNTSVETVDTGSNGTVTVTTEGTARVTVTNATTTVANNLTVTGNLQVDGTQTTVNSTTMTVDDKNIVLGSGAANDAAADGGGITLESGDGNKTFNWVDSTDAWTSSEHIHVVAGKRLGIGAAPSYPLHVTSTGTESVRFYGDSGGSNALLRFQFDEVNDDLVAAAGPRTFIGDGSADIVIGTSNSSFTPANSFISLEHGGKIRMAAGASPTLASEGITIDTSGNIGIAQASPDYALDVTGDIGFTSQMRGASGSESAPAYSFDGDSDSGMWRGGVNILSFATAGTERLRITSTGELLQSATGGNNKFTTKRTGAAGSNNDVFFELRSRNTADQEVGSFLFQRESAGDDAYFVLKTRNTGGSNTERLRITSTGIVQLPAGANQRIGIADRHNSTGVGHTLTISPGGGYGSGKTSGDLLLSRGRGLGGAAGGAIKFGYNAGDNTAGLDTVQMILDVNGKVGINELTPERQLDVNGDILGTSYMLKSNSSASSGSQAHMFRPADNTLAFATNGANERFRIDSSGRVSIGNNPTVDSNANLHVEDASGECGVWIEGNTGGAGAYLLLRNNSTSSNPKTYIGGLDAGGQGISQIEFHNLDNDNNEGQLTLHTRPSGGSMTERLRLASNGNVSIGGGAPTPSASGYNKACLHIMQSNSGTSVGSQIKFTINALGHNAGDGGFISYWGDKNFYYNNKENSGLHRFFVTDGSGTSGEKLQIGSTAVYVTGHFEATTKSFIIDHPTKENHRLRYACLEGPENSVYVRGRTKDGTIDLPDYWTGLVDEDSITVNLTPIGNKRVWVESINNNSVNIASDDDIDCFYTVFAERKDVEKLVVEEEK